MSDVTQQVVEWLHEQHDWLQEAAELVIDTSVPTDEAIDHIVSCLKSEDGRAITTARSFAALGGTQSEESELRLQYVSNISGIENLSPDRPLEFGVGNLAVVYGPNGSGKSGYIRILKKVCGKSSAGPLWSNVFEPPPTERKCTLGYRIAGSDNVFEWHPDDGHIVDLHAVDIFDAGTATAYLSNESQPSYTPPLLTFFQNLAHCCSRVSHRLKVERTQLVSALPTLPPLYQDTTTATAYQQLRADMPEDRLSKFVQWSEGDQQELDQLTTRLKTKDPATSAKEVRAKKAQVDKVLEELEGASNAVDQGKLDALRAARVDARKKRKIAEEVAKACSESAELAGIGTEAWKSLWEAARSYSQIPYPNQAFPVTDDGARCVLCHQALAADAKQRLQDFEAYVQGKAESDATSAQKDYKELLDGLPTTPSDESFQSRCEAAGIEFATFQQDVAAYWSSVRHVIMQLKSGEPDEEAMPVPLPQEFQTVLKAKSADLEQQANQYDEDAQATDLTALERQKRELEARKWVSEQRQAIEAELDRLKKLDQLDGLLKLANSRAISLKAGEIAEKVITEAYVARFNAELKALGARRIRVALVKTRTDHGRPMHKLVLKDAVSKDISPKLVLSDGEHRVVALAAFLADVAQKPYAAPFVFDDPISSLDSEYEWQVALRLAELAEHRQVLIFTHRLSLYGAIQDAAAKRGENWRKANLELRYIESFGGSSGHPANEQVWNASTKKANNLLLDQLTRAEKAAETDGAEAYQLYAKGICTDFRKLIERTVESDLLNEVVKRHRRSITTDNRITKLAHIESGDCEFFDTLMTKYSCYEHSQSTEVPVFIPEAEELRTDLESLRDWRTNFKQRGCVVT